MVIWGPTAKFNPRQYFQLYGTFTLNMQFIQCDVNVFFRYRFTSPLSLSLSLSLFPSFHSFSLPSSSLLPPYRSPSLHLPLRFRLATTFALALHPNCPLSMNDNRQINILATSPHFAKLQPTIEHKHCTCTLMEHCLCPVIA